MTIVGNDVVDLDDPAIEGHHFRERFVARVCTPAERDRVRSKTDLWTLFAAKEAAYKALVKLGESPGFGHRHLVVSAGLEAVTWGLRTLRLDVIQDNAFVHAVCWSRGSIPAVRVTRTSEPLAQSARAVLRELVAETTGLPALEIDVVRDLDPGGWDGFGPPRAEHRGRPADVDVSLSHDGRFAAAAVAVGRG